MSTRKGKSAKPWFERVAEKIVRESMGFRLAALEIGEELTVEEAETLQRRKEFQRVLTAERFKFYRELADDPGRTKQAALGRLEKIIEALLAEGEYDKAAEVQLKAARIAGWLGPESNVNVFATLTEQDFKNVREKLKDIAQRQDTRGTQGTSEVRSD